MPCFSKTISHLQGETGLPSSCVLGAQTGPRPANAQRVTKRTRLGLGVPLLPMSPSVALQGPGKPEPQERELPALGGVTGCGHTNDLLPRDVTSTGLVSISLGLGTTTDNKTENFLQTERRVLTQVRKAKGSAEGREAGVALGGHGKDTGTLEHFPKHDRH